MSQPHITEISIKNLRGLKDLTLEDARLFNLIVGPAEIGKTSVLEGICLGAGGGNLRGLYLINKFRGAKLPSAEKMREALSHIFYNAAEKGMLISVKVKRDAEEYGYDVKFRQVRSGDETEQEEIFSSDDGFGYAEGDRLKRISAETAFFGAPYDKDEKSLMIEEKPDGAASLKIKPATPTGIFAKEDTEQRLPHAFYDDRNISETLKTVVINKKDKAITRVLQKINDAIESIDIVGEDPYIDIGLPRKAPFHIAGKGICEATATLGALCARERYAVFLQDEFGKGLYHAALGHYLKAVLRFAKEHGRQIFATTHSRDVLIALKEAAEEQEELREDVMCYSMLRNKDNRVKAINFPYKGIEDCINKDVEIR